MTVLERETDVPALGNGSQPCSSCGAPLAGDQRYCLNCGERQAAPRVPFEQLTPAPSTEPRPGPAQNRGAAMRSFWSNAGFLPLAAGAGVVLLAVLLGVVIGHGNGQKAAAPVAAKPQVITVATAGAAPSAAASPAAFVGDWPAGKKGYTVQLQSLSKGGSDPTAVDAAKTSAESKGAGAVGALDSDRFDSLPSGRYVVYSGVFTSKAQAAKALTKLKKSFPGAKVIKVASGGGGGGGGGKTVGKSSLKDLQSSSPKDYSKKSRKLPDKLKLPGKPPPKDNKKPGGGGGVQVIGG